MAKLQKEKLVDIVEVTEVSRETGEVVTYTKNVYDKQTHDENVKLILSKNELHQYVNEVFGKFFFCFYRKIEKIDMKEQFKMRFIYLSSFLDYNSSNIVDISTGKKLGVTNSMLKDFLNLGEAEFNKTMSAFKKNNLIIKDKMFYKLNTDYCLKGDNKNVKNKCVRVFIDNIRELYLNTEPKNHKQLYYFFKILPYVNLQFNIITEDIEADTKDFITPMKMSDLCKKINVYSKDPKKLYNMLKTFKIGDEYVICKHEVHNMDAFSINPKLYYKGDKLESLKGIQLIFDMAKAYKHSSENCIV